MFKGASLWWKRLDSYDRDFIRTSVRVVGGLIIIITAMVIFGNLGWALAGGDGTPTSDKPVTLTVLETTTQMEDDSAAAVAVGPDGTKVLLYGNWVEGQQVTAYPYDGPGGTQPVYGIEQPREGGNGGWGVFGGIVFALVFLIGLFFARIEISGRLEERRRQSRNIVSAAIS